MTRFSRLVITERATRDELGRNLMATFKQHGRPVVVCDVLPARLEAEAGRLNTLYAETSPGDRWIRRADHGALYVRPGEHYLRHASGCESDCDYCFLRARSRLHPTVVFTDIESLLSELRWILEQAPSEDGIFFNAGEFADSLVAAADFELIPRIVEAMPLLSARLELRTKSERVESLLGLAHRGHTTVAFSCSPDEAITLHERRTSTLARRVAAATALQDDGYPLALKFEPVLATRGWEDDYVRMLDQMQGSIDFARVEHVSIGTLRWGQALASDPVFSSRMRTYAGAADRVPYREGEVNFTGPLEERLRTYRSLLVQLAVRGLDRPTYLSLEAPEVVQLLAAEFTNVRRNHG